MTEITNGSPSADEQAPAEGEGLSRRKFLTRAVGAIVGAIAAAIGVPSIFYIAGPRDQTGAQEWIRVGSASSVEPNAQTLMKATVERRAGYLTTTEEISVFVNTPNGQDFVAFSNVCTHLGCRVRWVDEQDGFFCPCHNAIFGPDGSVVQGPPPRPLDRYETMVEEGQLYIKEI